jgi:Na+/proline symporter
MKYVNHALGIIFGFLFGRLLQLFVVAATTDIKTIQDFNDSYSNTYLVVVVLGVITGWLLIGLWKSTFFTSLSKGFLMLSFFIFLNVMVFSSILNEAKIEYALAMSNGNTVNMPDDPFNVISEMSGEISGLRFIMFTFLVLGAVSIIISFFKNNIIVIKRK